MALIGTVAAVLGVVIAVAAWLWPQSPSDGDEAAGARATTPRVHAITTNGAGPATTGAAAMPAARYLDRSDMAPEVGTDFLVPLPRAVRDQAEWSSHAIAVSCPSNQAGDQAHDVTFVLHGRYHRFDADVRPWYPPDSDTRSATYVTAIGAITQPDGQLVTKEAGAQKSAFLDAPKPITAVIDGAEKLTLHVQCGDPNGVVVLGRARLTP